MSGCYGTLKVSPENEMMAIDMAEALRSLSTFNGILYGCRLSIVNNELRLSPGWVLIGGRLGAFEVTEQNATTLKVDCPEPSSKTKYNIVIICDLANASHPFYIDLKTDNYLHNTTNGLDVRVAATSDEAFNAQKGVRYLTLGTVEVSPQGVPDASTLDVATGRFPDYGYATNQKALTAITNTAASRWSIASDYFDYFDRTKHRTAFFKNNTIVGDGLKVPANSVKTFPFRKEDGSVVVIKTGDTVPARPQHVPFIVLDENGNIPSGSNMQSKGDAPSTTKEYYDPDTKRRIKSLYAEWQNYGIVGVEISNASSGGTQGDKCVVQSFAIGKIGNSDDNYTLVTVRNTGSAAAKIKIKVTCLYVRNIEYP